MNMIPAYEERVRVYTCRLEDILEAPHAAEVVVQMREYLLHSAFANAVLKISGSCAHTFRNRTGVALAPGLP